MLDQSVSILAHLKEISFLFCGLYFPATVRTFTIHKLGFCPERLAWCTVKTFIRSFIDVALIIKTLKHFLYLLLMIIICCTDKLIIRYIEVVAYTLYLTCHSVDKFLGSDAFFFCLLLDFLTMLVSTGLEKYIISVFSLVSCDGICQYYLI